MTILISLGLVVVGIAALIYGSHFLIENAALLSKRLGVSALLIGLTVVAFGTSAPELAASLVAAFEGIPELVMGNVVGSNIANLALVLGTASVIFPLTASRGFVRRDLPFMLIASLLLIPITFDANQDGLGHIVRLEGLLLVALLIAYVLVLLRSDEPSEVEKVAEALSQGDDRALWKIISLAAVGGVLLVLGAQFLVRGASDLARIFGISERIIGLTVVAIGTSLPELAASITAARKRQGDIIIGNLVGSNIFNILSIIGIVALVKPLSVTPELFNVDFWLMVAVSLLAAGMLFSRLRFSRREGYGMLGIYAAYMIYLAVTQFAS